MLGLWFLRLFESYALWLLNMPGFPISPRALDVGTDSSQAAVSNLSHDE